MRVNGPNGTAPASATSVSRRSSSGAFPLSETSQPQARSAAVALRTLAESTPLSRCKASRNPVERRHRAVKHGRRALDALDELEIGPLAGNLDQGTLLRLKAVAADLKDGSGDQGLDQVLSEIDLRVAVELAKAGMN